MRNFQAPGRSPVFATNGMVATSHPLAAAEALAVLKAGGNAADAAITGALLLGVCEPQMTGIGGDMFALIRPAGSQDIHALNGSGRAPRATDSAALRAAGVESIVPGHPASITVPGAIDGMIALSERFGRLGLDRAIAPVLPYFENGVPIAPRVAFDIAPQDSHLKGHARRHYLKDGRAYRMGETFALPTQADVLRRVARNGRSAFYDGEVMQDMLSALREVGACHEAEDFQGNAADWGDPVSGPYRSVELVEHPPNGQGAVAILLAGILQNFDLAAMPPFSVERLHIEAEATRLAYDARDRFLADPDHMTRLAHLLAPETAAALAAKIDPKRAMPTPAPVTEDVHRDTVLITVVDGDGMAVSLIYSIFTTFGSGIASDRFGILLHNRGSGFNVTPGHPNEIGPGKRPLHTIIPGMTRIGGRVDLVFGVMGGQFQAAGHVRLLSNLLDYGMDIQEAIDAPRIFADPKLGKLRCETGIAQETVAALAALGHSVEVCEDPIGGAQAIRIDHDRGVLVAGSDPRKDGCALGY